MNSPSFLGVFLGVFVCADRINVHVHAILLSPNLGPICKYAQGGCRGDEERGDVWHHREI